MESSRIHYYLLKAAGVGLLVTCAYLLVAAVFFPEELHSEEPLSAGDRIAFATIFPVVGLLVGFTAWRAAYVRIYPKHLEVLRNGRRLEVPWAEVAGISKLPCTSPPIYWIKFHDKPGVAVIPWSWIVISVGFWAWDFTDFKDNLEVRVAEAFRVLNRT